MKNETPTQNIEQMHKSAEAAEALLKQLANAKRLMILCHLIMGEKTVSELAEAIDLSQSALSQHLTKLREANLVSAEKRGAMVHYKICSIEAQALLAVLNLIYCKK